MLNNPKDLDLSYKTDLDFWDCFWIETPFYNQRNTVFRIFGVNVGHFNLSFQCDGYSLDLHNGPSLEGIALLNIPSIYGGTNLWGDNPSQKKRRKAQKQMKKDKEKELSTSSMSSIELGIAVQGE